MKLWNCRTWLLQALVLLICLTLSGPVIGDFFFSDSLCVSNPDESHEHFLCTASFPPEVKQAFTRDQILADQDLRISPEFRIESQLKPRVGFWFDVYTVYDSNHRLIHHTDFPWLVFKILDHSELMSRPARFKWMNQMKSDELAKKEIAQFRGLLQGLKNKIKHKNLSDVLFSLNEEEKKTVQLLQTIPGPFKKNLARAISNVRMQTGQKNFYKRGLLVSRDYMKTMESLFLERRLPIELARLPMVESSFNHLATSKVGAAGLWQFMSGTGKKFLTINNNIDERRSPFKSTEAATYLLKENYLLFQNWSLALTAYNHGPGGVRKAVRKAGTKDLAEIVRVYETKNFNFASQNFYSEFLGALYAEKYANEIFGDLELPEPRQFERVILSLGLRPKVILDWLDLSGTEFIKMNPDLKKALQTNITLPKGFDIYLAPDMAFRFRAQEKRVLETLKKPIKYRKIADL